ncbi:MAG TPA: caspase family protein [Polyangiaceae bacterium]|nr:caspase family protein [Polyangiaceae bacterium]
MRWLLALVLVLLPSLGRAEPLRLLVAAGHGAGLPGEPPLRHAQKDAAGVRDVLVRHGGVAPEHAFVLNDPRPAALFAALEVARALALQRRPEQVTLFFYFSGHGDQERLHLGGEALSVAELGARLRAFPAGLKVVVTDACRSADLRPKGPRAEPGFAVNLEGEDGARGLVWLFATSEGQAAHESEELSGALFTHYWVSGLRGAADADADRRVTLAESYRFAHDQTLYRSARSGGALQRPLAVLDLREAGPLVLTRLSDAGAGLALPRAADVHYLVYAPGSRSVLGEAWGLPERDVRLALPPGRYVVQARGPSVRGAAELVLAKGEWRKLEAREFRPVAEEVLARKGGAVVARPNELGLSLGAFGSRLASVGGLAALSYRRRPGDWALGVRAFGAYGGERAGVHEVRVALAGGGVSLDHVIALGATTLRAGVGANAALVDQRRERRDAGRLARAGYDAREASRALAAGPELHLAVDAPVGDAYFVGAQAAGELLFARFGDAVAPAFGARLEIGAGLRF